MAVLSLILTTLISKIVIDSITDKETALPVTATKSGIKNLVLLDLADLLLTENGFVFHHVSRPQDFLVAKGRTAISVLRDQGPFCP